MATKVTDFKGLTGGHSKYGGARDGVFKKKIVGSWFCQSCGKELAAGQTPWLHQINESLVIRVCALCLRDQSKKFIERKQMFFA